MNAASSSETGKSLQQFVHLHPWLFILALVVILEVILFPFSLLIKNFPLFPVTFRPFRGVIIEIGLIVAAFTFLTLLHWWRRAGYTIGIRWRDVLVCLFPTILTALVAFLSFSPFIFGVLHISLGRLVLIGLLACLVGVTEESLFRGLVLQTLLPKGVLRALLLSSLIFALLHVGNLFAGLFWGYVVEQVLFAFAIGLAFAVMRVRTGSIWPGIILHSLNDFAALTLISVTGIPHPMLAGGLIAGGIWCLMYGIYAAIALRPSKLRELTWAGANP